MVISFKDQVLEEQLLRRSATQKGFSASTLARRDLQRYAWLLAGEDPIDLSYKEFLTVASIVRSIDWFQEPSQIKRLPLMIEDCILSTTNAQGVYTKVERFGIDPESLFRKLRLASPLQLLALLDRAESFPQNKIDQEPWGEIKSMRTIYLQSDGFSNDAREHLLDKLKLTAPDQAITWQGTLDGNTINPFIKDLKMGETVIIVAKEGDKEVATFDTVFLRCNTLRILDPYHTEVRLEFRNKQLAPVR